MYPDLSDKGKNWLKNTLNLLQDYMEEGLINNKQIEKNNDAFQTFAYNTHPRSYEKAGLFDLPVSDLIKIAKTPNISDLITPNGIAQICTVMADYAKQKKEEGKNLINNAASTIYIQNNKKFNS